MREINQKVTTAASIENKYLLPGHYDTDRRYSPHTFNDSVSY
ncbi:Uncharacterised protein [Yersinia aldovae]|nr:Uncharacterised protein [Yersinia aldovae]